MTTTYIRTEAHQEIEHLLSCVFEERGAAHQTYRDAGKITNLHERVNRRTKIAFKLQRLDMEEFKLNQQWRKLNGEQVQAPQLVRVDD